MRSDDFMRHTPPTQNTELDPAETTGWRVHDRGVSDVGRATSGEMRVGLPLVSVSAGNCNMHHANSPSSDIPGGAG